MSVHLIAVNLTGTEINMDQDNIRKLFAASIGFDSAVDEGTPHESFRIKVNDPTAKGAHLVGRANKPWPLFIGVYFPDDDGSEVNKVRMATIMKDLFNDETRVETTQVTTEEGTVFRVYTDRKKFLEKQDELFRNAVYDDSEDIRITREELLEYTQLKQPVLEELELASRSRSTDDKVWFPSAKVDEEDNITYSKKDVVYWKASIRNLTPP